MENQGRARDFPQAPWSESERSSVIDSTIRGGYIQEGGFDEEGRLVLTNSGTGSTLDVFGMTLYERLSIFDLNKDSFELEQEMSSDGDETWNVLTKLHYTLAQD